MTGNSSEGPGPCLWVAGFINSCTGFIYLSEGGWRTVDVIYFLTELVLIVASGWCYRQLLLPSGRAGGELAFPREAGPA